MNTKNKIVAILMAGIVAMAIGVPMAMSADVDTTANVGEVLPTYDCTATVTTAPDVGLDGTVGFVLVVTDLNGADEISDAGWTAEWGGRSAVPLTINSGETTATSKTFEGSDTIPYCTAAATYTVSFQEPVDAEVCNDDFVVGSYTGFNLNFIAIDYAGVTVNVKKVVTPGDLHNVGNSNMKIKIHATAMTPGATYIPADPSNVDMNLDAKVPGTTGVEKPLPACNWVLFDHEFVCCTPESLDFSITAPEGTEGPYTGLIEISPQP